MQTGTIRRSPQPGILAVRAESGAPDLPALMSELGGTVRAYKERTDRQIAELRGAVDDVLKSADMAQIGGGGGLRRGTSDLEIAAFLSAARRR